MGADMYRWVLAEAGYGEKPPRRETPKQRKARMNRLERRIAELEHEVARLKGENAALRAGLKR